MSEITFPKEFKWGAATSSYQIEGAWDADGKGRSIWDTFSHTPGKISDGSTGDIACDHYTLWQTDTNLMKKLNLDAYRFSLSWPRIFPEGKGSINSRGVDFYDRLIDDLLKKNIEPFITLYHWDLPQALQDKGGWLNRDIADRFAHYTETVVRRYGDRVKHWITLNEPFIVYGQGYFTGEHAPGEKSFFKSVKVIHNLLLAHGKALERIRSVDSSLTAGITNAFAPVYPRSEKDTRAVRMAHAFMMSIFMDPIFKGRYPEAIERLIKITNRSIKSSDFDIISKPVDFIGINNYTRAIVKNTLMPIPGFQTVTPEYRGVEFTDMGWEVFPEAIYKTLIWIKEEYGNPPVYITENGMASPDVPKNNRVRDIDRIDFLKRYIYMVKKAMNEGADVKGYFAWSLLDNFEWAYGYSKRFGLIYVDYETQQRIIKDSGKWYAELCRTGRL